VSTTETGKRERTKQANRAAILEAAREVFSDIGYGAATVRDVIRRTDLAAGTFYNYFPDKESVFRALIEDAAEEARVHVRAARRAGRTFEEFASPRTR
jgi:AcrR family transcriptional regulator